MRRFIVFVAVAAFALALSSLPRPVARVAADPQGSPHLELDADPTNGTRPCDPIDATATVPASTPTYNVAICIDEQLPEAIWGFEARVIWSGGVATAIEVPDVPVALDDNPDFNDAPGPDGNGDGWGCTGYNTAWPKGDRPDTAETDAYITCVVSPPGPGEMAASPGLLATVTMQASGAGTETFAFSTLGDSQIGYLTANYACSQGVSCPGAMVIQASEDADGDGVDDATDNCPGIANPGQQNTDREIDNGPGIAAKDITVPNAISDTDGDACETDGDADNDGLADASEAPLGNCGDFDGTDASHPSPAGGDLTNDDNGNGVPAPTDVADNGPSWDTDNDGALDGAECQLNFNPRSSSRPSAAQCGGAVDADGDGLPLSAERCKWGTIDTAVTGVDSDGDGKKDCVEANDTNGDGVQNFPGDTINSAKAANSIIAKTMDFDLNGDGVVNFPGDTILSAKLSNHVGGICV